MGTSSTWGIPVAMAVAVAAHQPSGVVDEATFTFTRAGTPYGSESFRIIRRIGADGPEFLAQCTRTSDGRIVKTALTTDSLGSPTTYSRTVTGGTGGNINARRMVNRLTVDEAGPQASTRDYAFTTGALILDEDVIHQLYFVTLGAPRGVTWVAPGARASGQAVLAEVGRENVVIKGVNVLAVRYTFGSGDSRREIWIDSRRRLLKVSAPAQQLVGTRDALPR